MKPHRSTKKGAGAPQAATYFVTAGHDIGAPAVQGRTAVDALEVAKKFRELGHPVVVIRDASGKLAGEAELRDLASKPEI